MAKQISELPLGSAGVSQEIPSQEAGTTYRLSLAGIRDWVLASWATVYDPTGLARSPFDRANHTGVQPIGTVTNALNKTGDTMSGALLLPVPDPTVANQAATKAYVDKAAGGFPDAPADTASYARKDNAWTKVVPLGGAAMTGRLDMNAGAQITGGLTVSSGGLTVSGAINFGASALTCGPVVSSGQVQGANFYTAGQVQGGNIYTPGQVLGGSGYFNGRCQVNYVTGGFDVIVGAASFSLGSTSWNAINVTPSSYPIYMSFAGTNFFTFEPDRFAPLASGVRYLGTATQRWLTMYSVNNPNVSSDAKLKQDVRPFSTEELAAAREIRPLLRLFRMKAEVTAGNAKIHAGIIAQDIETVFTAHGLDISQYAFYEISDDMTYATDENGQEVATPTGEQTRSLIYVELLVWLIAALDI